RLAGSGAERHLLIRIADTQIEGQIRPHAPVVLRERVQDFLVAIVNVVAGVALTENVRGLIPEKYVNRSIFIVAAHALGEALWRDKVAKIAAELDRVIAANQGHVVNDLIIVLDAELRRVPVWPNA